MKREQKRWMIYTIKRFNRDQEKEAKNFFKEFLKKYFDIEHEDEVEE